MGKKSAILILIAHFLIGIMRVIMFFSIIGMIFVGLDMTKYSSKSKPTVMYVEEYRYNNVSFRGSGQLRVDAQLKGYVIHDADTTITRCNVTVNDSIIGDKIMEMIQLISGEKISFDQYLVTNDSIIPVWAIEGSKWCRFRKDKAVTKHNNHGIARFILFLFLMILAYQLTKYVSKILDERVNNLIKKSDYKE